MNSLQNPLNANYPQDVTQKPGENAVFIVYALCSKRSPRHD